MKPLRLTLVFGVIATAVFAQQDARISSPRGVTATEIGGTYVSGQQGSTYQGGKWIEIAYGRPIKRGRELWGTGDNYGKMLMGGAPIWRAGANQTTQLKTEVPLVFNGKALAAGEYSLFVDLKPGAWTLVVSSWPAAQKYDPNNKSALWGAYGYTPDRDVVRAPMEVETLPISIDQLTWQFADMSASGGLLVFMWDKTIASVPFNVGA